MDSTKPNHSISKDELNALPLFNHEGRYELIEDLDHARQAVAELKKHTTLGFDTETRPSFSKGEFYHAAMLQLATHETCYIFRLNKIPLNQVLVEILQDEAITKVGVAIRDDIIGLNKIYPFNPAGFVDLATLTSSSRSNTLGLRALTGIFLGKRLTKGSKVTNWERDVLSESQIRYAANDAFAGLLIYEKLREMNLA